jgi:corrinoid protein of di/trimethylamine methyltransferase
MGHEGVALTEILDEIQEAIFNCDANIVSRKVHKAVAQKLDPLSILDKMNAAIRTVGEKFGQGDIFITDLIGSAEAMNAGVRILEPLILQGRKRITTLAMIAMATAEGDIHDIGKNIVITMLRATGFNVTDLGADVSTEKIVETIAKEGSQVVGVSALLTSTVAAQEKLIKRLTELGTRDTVRVIVGGAAVTREWSKRIGSDGYAPDGLTTVELVKQLTGVA